MIRLKADIATPGSPGAPLALSRGRCEQAAPSREAGPRIETGLTLTDVRSQVASPPPSWACGRPARRLDQVRRVVEPALVRRAGGRVAFLVRRARIGAEGEQQFGGLRGKAFVVG